MRRHGRKREGRRPSRTLPAKGRKGFGNLNLVLGPAGASARRNVPPAHLVVPCVVPDAKSRFPKAVRPLAGWFGGAAPLQLLTIAILLLLPAAATAQSVAIDLGQTGQPGATARLVQLTALIGMLSLAPSLLVMATAFARIVIVLSLLRSAIGAQGIPPNPVLIGLALFLTFFVMQPVFEASWAQGIVPMTEGRLGEIAGLEAAAEPFRRFMAANVREDDLAHFIELANLPEPASADAAPYRALVPAFMVSELRRGFEIGFLLFLPFLIIDMVVASVLMSLGMMMLPPSVVALPFKLIFFVLVDGWRLVSASLVQGFAGM